MFIPQKYIIAAYELFKKRIKKISVDKLVAFEEHRVAYIALLSTLIRRSIPTSDYGEIFWQLMGIRKRAGVSLSRVAM